MKECTYGQPRGYAAFNDLSWGLVVLPSGNGEAAAEWMIDAWRRAGSASREGLQANLHPNQWALATELGLDPTASVRRVLKRLKKRAAALDAAEAARVLPPPPPPSCLSGCSP